jgi:hypothetical protein
VDWRIDLFESQFLVVPPKSPGTTRSRHRFACKEIYFAVSKIHRFAALYRGFQCGRADVFCKRCTRKVNTFPGCETNSRIFAKREIAEFPGSSSGVSKEEAPKAISSREPRKAEDEWRPSSSGSKLMHQLIPLLKKMSTPDSKLILLLADKTARGQ